MKVKNESVITKVVKKTLIDILHSIAWCLNSWPISDENVEFENVKWLLEKIHATLRFSTHMFTYVIDSYVELELL